MKSKPIASAALRKPMPQSPMLIRHRRRHRQMRMRFVSIALNLFRCYPRLSQQMIKQHARTGTPLSIDISLPTQIRDRADAERIPGPV